MNKSFIMVATLLATMKAGHTLQSDDDSIDNNEQMRSCTFNLVTEMEQEQTKNLFIELLSNNELVFFSKVADIVNGQNCLVFRHALHDPTVILKNIIPTSIICQYHYSGNFNSLTVEITTNNNQQPTITPYQQQPVGTVYQVGTPIR